MVFLKKFKYFLPPSLPGVWYKAADVAAEAQNSDDDRVMAV